MNLIEIKEDSPEKLEKVQGKPTKNFLFAEEINLLASKLAQLIAIGQPLDRIISLGAFFINGNEITVGSNTTWVIDGGNYNINTDLVFTIPYSAVGSQRFDLLLLTKEDDNVIILTGDEGPIAIEPTRPNGSIILSKLLITSNSVGGSPTNQVGKYLGIYETEQEVEDDNFEAPLYSFAFVFDFATNSGLRFSFNTYTGWQHFPLQQGLNEVLTVNKTSEIIPQLRALEFTQSVDSLENFINVFNKVLRFDGGSITGGLNRMGVALPILIIGASTPVVETQRIIKNLNSDPYTLITSDYSSLLRFSGSAEITIPVQGSTFQGVEGGEIHICVSGPSITTARVRPFSNAVTINGVTGNQVIVPVNRILILKRISTNNYQTFYHDSMEFTPVNRRRFVFGGLSQQTGVTSEVVIHSLRIPGGTYLSQDAFELLVAATKSVTITNVPFRAYIGNTQNSLENALFNNVTFGQSNRQAFIQRVFFIDGNNLRSLNPINTTSTSPPPSTGTVGGIISNLNFSQDLWVTLTASPTVATEVVGCDFISIRPFN